MYPFSEQEVGLLCHGKASRLAFQGGRNEGTLKKGEAGREREQALHLFSEAVGRSSSISCPLQRPFHLVSTSAGIGEGV